MCEMSDQMILDVEKFHATVSGPQGMCIGM